MLKKFVEFDSLTEAQTFADTLDGLKGSADQYSKPIEHPSNGKAVVLTCPNCHEFMTQAQIDAGKDQAGVVALGYSQLEQSPDFEDF